MAEPEVTMADVPPSICEVLLDVLVEFGVHVKPPRGIKPPAMVVALYEAADRYYAPVITKACEFRAAAEDKAHALDEIAAVIAEPLDERDGHGPTRTQQFARIEAIVSSTAQNQEAQRP